MTNPAPTPMTAAEIEALRELHSRQPSVFPQKRLRDLWRQSGGKWHGPYVETYTIPEERFEAFCMAIEARLLATIEAQAKEIGRLRTLLTGALDSLEYVAPSLIGYGVRNERIAAISAALKKHAMTDAKSEDTAALVERLRVPWKFNLGRPVETRLKLDELCNLQWQAADALERLAADNARLTRERDEARAAGLAEAAEIADARDREYATIAIKHEGTYLGLAFTDKVGAVASVAAAIRRARAALEQGGASNG